jgi:plasmid stabilization system protein ParE
MKPIVFDSEADEELHAAARFYEERRAGLGDEFMEEVQRATERIASVPQSFPPYGGSGLRKCILRRFPYTVFFFEQEERVWIAAVAHQKRRPGYWSDRHPD